MLVEIQKADEIADFASYFIDIDDIFFKSSAKRDFCSHEERLSFRERWLARYILKHRGSFFVALEACDRVSCRLSRKSDKIEPFH